LVEGAHPIRTGHDAVPAAKANLLVNKHRSVSTLVRRPRGANLDALRVIAFLAHSRKYCSRSGNLPTGPTLRTLL
jgi:hypothetical protein